MADSEVLHGRRGKSDTIKHSIVQVRQEDESAVPPLMAGQQMGFTREVRSIGSVPQTIFFVVDKSARESPRNPARQMDVSIRSGPNGACMSHGCGYLGGMRWTMA
jgi:hypothetical protein